MDIFQDRTQDVRGWRGREKSERVSAQPKRGLMSVLCVSVPGFDMGCKWVV